MVNPLGESTKIGVKNKHFVFVVMGKCTYNSSRLFYYLYDINRGIPEVIYNRREMGDS